MQTMWVLINKNNGKLIKIWVDQRDGYDIYATGFNTRKGLLAKIVYVQLNEEIRKVEFEL